MSLTVPPTRVQSMHDVPQNPMQRGAHPFAYHAGGALPFSAIGPDQSVGSEEAVAGRHRPESEVLSRGAGMRAFAKPKDATPGAGLVGGQGMDTPPSGESPAMGTFGMIASQENLIQQPIVGEIVSNGRKFDLTSWIRPNQILPGGNPFHHSRHSCQLSPVLQRRQPDLEVQQLVTRLLVPLNSRPSLPLVRTSIMSTPSSHLISVKQPESKKRRCKRLERQLWLNCKLLDRPKNLERRMARRLKVPA